MTGCRNPWRNDAVRSSDWSCATLGAATAARAPGSRGAPIGPSSSSDLRESGRAGRQAAVRVHGTVAVGGGGCSGSCRRRVHARTCRPTSGMSRAPRRCTGRGAVEAREVGVGGADAEVARGDAQRVCAWIAEWDPRWCARSRRARRSRQAAKPLMRACFVYAIGSTSASRSRSVGSSPRRTSSPLGRAGLPVAPARRRRRSGRRARSGDALLGVALERRQGEPGRSRPTASATATATAVQVAILMNVSRMDFSGSQGARPGQRPGRGARGRS